LPLWVLHAAGEWGRGSLMGSAAALSKQAAGWLSTQAQQHLHMAGAQQQAALAEQEGVGE